MVIPRASRPSDPNQQCYCFNKDKCYHCKYQSFIVHKSFLRFVEQIIQLLLKLLRTYLLLLDTVHLFFFPKRCKSYSLCFITELAESILGPVRQKIPYLKYLFLKCQENLIMRILTEILFILSRDLLRSFCKVHIF